MKPPNKVTLYISCQKLIDLDTINGVTDPLCKLFIRGSEESEWIFDEMTETKNNDLNPQFNKALTINYYFEKNQYLKFEIYNANMGDEHQFLGKVETTVAKIMSSKN